MGKSKNFHVIEAVYSGATVSRGSRVKIHSARFSKTKIIEYDHSMNDIADMAEAYLKKHGFHVVGHAEAGRGYYIITDTFKTI